MKLEVWKDIEDYEEYYQISNYGRIKSKERYSDCCYGKQRLIKEKIIVPTADKYGYLRIMLSKNGDKKRFKIHQLVAKAFLENYDEGKVIHHIDYNSQNNYFENLYVCTKKEHTTLHNKTDRLIRELIKQDLIEFKNGEYFVKSNGL